MAAFINILEFMVIVAVWVLVNFVMCSSRLYFTALPTAATLKSACVEPSHVRRCQNLESMDTFLDAAQIANIMYALHSAVVTISGIPLRKCQGQPPLFTALPHCAAGSMLSTGRTHCKSCSSPSSASSILMCAFVWLLF